MSQLASRPVSHGSGLVTTQVSLVGVATPTLSQLSLPSGTGPRLPPSLTGSWTPSDGSQTKTFLDGGNCSAIYYDHGKPLDIGGGMTCSLGSTKDSNDRYALAVNQPPNSETLYVSFSGDNDAAVFDGAGTQLFTMHRS
ncbi:hypothetical protein [Calidifontibacter terrae]